MNDAAAVGAIVLAAGAGERMGAPKVRLLTPHGPLVAQHVERLREAGVVRPIVATRRDAVDFVSALRVGDGAFTDVADVRAVATDEPSQTIAAALVGAAPRALWLILPVDTAPASAATLRTLRSCLEAAGALAASPTYRGAGGHPVLVRDVVLAPYRDVPSPPPLREVLAALGSARVRVAVDEPAVASRLDTPTDFERFYGEPPRFG